MSESKQGTDRDFVRDVSIGFGIGLVYILIIIAVFGD